MKKLTLIATALFFTVSVFAQTLQEAQKEIDNENYFKARQILFKLINDPNQNKAEVAYYLGNAFLKSDDADSAKVLYKMVYNPDSRTATGYLANGRLALLAKNSAEAKQNFDRALQTTKMKNANVYYEIGDAYFRPTITDLQLAISNFESAYNLDNKNTTIILALGDAYLENSANDNTMGGKAMNKYEYASDLNKSMALAWIKIGRLSLRGRIYDQAITAFNKALEIDQRYPVVYKELATAYYYTRQYDKVKTNYEKYIELSPGDNQAKEFIINMYFSGKEYDKVIDEANRGLQNDPNNFVFYRAIGYSTYELKRYQDAAAAMQKFWDNPNKKVKDLDVIYSARIAAGVGDTAQAVKYFTELLAKDSNNCEFIGEYAKMLYQQARRYSDAIVQYNNKKAKCGSLSSLEVFYLGRSYYEVNDSVMADTLFAEFIQRNPTSPDGWYWRAQTNAVFGDPMDFKAMPYYSKYLEIAAADVSSPAKKRNVIKAYDYMGAYHMEKTKNNAQAKEYFMKVLELDPNDQYATEMMKSMK